MHRWILLSGIAFSMFTTTCKAGEIDSLLLFGDSYFDTGAGNAVAESLGQPFPNPMPPYANNRHSNGPIWIDYVSHLLHLHVTDFAVSGSETGSDNYFNPALGGLFQQLQRFEGSKPFITSRTLTIVDGGGNDYFSLLDDPSDLTPAGVAETTLSAITNLAQVFGELQLLGAKKTVMWNLGNMGLLPLFTDPALGLTELAPLYTGATLAFNAALLELVQEFNDTLSTDHKQIYIFDAFNVFNEIEAHLTAEGVNVSEHTITSLPGGGFIVTGPQPNDLAFYDQVHPTTFVWKIFANSMAAFIDTLVDGPRFIATEQDLAFETSRVHRDVVDNHFRTLHIQRYIRQCCDTDCCDVNPLQFYFDGEARWGSTHTRRGAQGFHYNTQAAMVGVDYRFDDCLTVGTSFTAQNTDSHIRKGRGKVDLKNYIPTLYASFTAPEFFIDADVSYYHHDFRKIRRHIPFLDRRARAHVDGWSVDTHLQAGYLYSCGCLTAMPILGIGYENLHINRYREKHAGFLDLAMTKQHQDSLVSKFGWQLFWNLCDCRYLPFAELTYEHEFLRNETTIRPRLFHSDDHSIDYANIGHPKRDLLKYAVGVDAQLGPDCLGNISYEGETTLGREYSNAVRVQFDISF